MNGIIAIVISIVSLFISIFASLFEYLWNKALRKRERRADLYKYVFEEILYSEMPKAREVLDLSENGVNNTEELEDVLRRMAQRAMIFKDENEKFYHTLIESLRELEDLTSGNSKKVSLEVADKINRAFSNIYNIVMKEIGI